MSESESAKEHNNIENAPVIFHPHLVNLKIMTASLGETQSSLHFGGVWTFFYYFSKTSWRLKGKKKTGKQDTSKLKGEKNSKESTTRKTMRLFDHFSLTHFCPDETPRYNDKPFQWRATMTAMRIARLAFNGAQEEQSTAIDNK